MTDNSIDNTDKLPEPTNLAALKAEVQRRWGMMDLLDILKDADFLTDFTDEFVSVATREALPRPVLRRRLLLALFALGTNKGIRQMAATGEHEEDEGALRRVRATRITRENLRRAITRVVNATFEAREAKWWDQATASDSKRFGSWESNLMTEFHARYGGCGVMIYWHVERGRVPGPRLGGPRGVTCSLLLHRCRLATLPQVQWVNRCTQRSMFTGCVDDPGCG